MKPSREQIKQKYGGRCAYSGTLLENDWQIDHIKPIRRMPYSGEVMFTEDDNEDNMVPVQRAVNHYKFSMPFEDFRERMKTLHLRLRKLPKNPKVERSIKRKQYLLKVAKYFGITEDKPFNGIFYFEIF